MRGWSPRPRPSPAAISISSGEAKPTEFQEFFELWDYRHQLLGTLRSLPK